MIDPTLPMRLGEYYPATVPDTLDLAELARLGVNHCCAVLDEENDHMMFFWGHRRGIDHHLADQVVIPKQFEAMVMMRIMSGSDWCLDREDKMVEMLMSYLKDDGFWWIPKMDGRMPWFGDDSVRPFFSPAAPALMARAMMAWYQYTGDEVWKGRIDAIIHAMNEKLVVHKDDGTAYIPVPAQIGTPDDYGAYHAAHYVEGHEWEGFKEPMDEKSVPGTEASVLSIYGNSPGVLANWYLLTGNEESMRLSREMTKFYCLPRFWADWKGGEYCGVVGHEHAHWTGHVHGYISNLRATLEYAIAAHDLPLMAWVRDGYEWTRQPTLARYGVLGDCQGCGCGRLISLAVKLTDAGVGDYWEDVDLYIRNMGVEMQITPDDVPGHELPCRSGRLDPAGAMIGGYANTVTKKNWMGCCSPHGLMGLYFAWDGTLRFDAADGIARVNLLLNRASPWIDIDSYIPFEGKVVLRNKMAHIAVVRIPLWADKTAVRCRIGDAQVQPEWNGRYMRIERLQPGDVVTIEFPMVEWTEVLTAPQVSRAQMHENSPASPLIPQDEPTTFTIRGNTIVNLSKPLENSPMFLKRAERFAGSVAPMREVTRFATPLVIKW